MGTLKSFILPLGILLFSVVQCDEVKEGCEVAEFYLNPAYSNYKVETVALLPMAYDDTTNVGTFYSTNYFYNRLVNEYDSFKLIDIDKILASDSIIIDNLLLTIRDSLRINVDTFYTTDLGKFLKYNNCDAIIIGNVFEYLQYESVPNRFKWLYTQRETKVNFNYFMVSLHDGSILWAANVNGLSKYLYEFVFPPQPMTYPPLDEALSNGIDALIIKLRKEINLESK